MSEKKDHKDEKKEEKKGEKKEETPEGSAKKRKGLLFGILGVLGVAGLGGGAFFAGKILGAKSALAALTPVPVVEGKKSKAAKAAAAKDAHGEPAKDAHGEPAKDAHGEPAKDAHGEPAKDAHGEPAKGGDASKEAKDKADRGKPENGFGEVVEIPRMDINVGNPTENRFLRVTVAIEFRGGATQGDELKRRLPQFRDMLIMSVSGKNRTELLSDKGKEKIRRELMNRINEVTEKPVANIYFSEFLVE